ncbi:hypothetical protein YC2023_006951 [Brassica napus]
MHASTASVSQAGVGSSSVILSESMSRDGDHFDGDLESEKTDDMSEDDEKEVDGKAAIVSKDT